MASSPLHPNRRQKRAVFSVWGYRPDFCGIGRFVPSYVDALSGLGWAADVLTPYPSYPSWRLDRSLPQVSLEQNGAVRVTRYVPYVPRRHSALTRGLHELSMARGVLRNLPRIAQGADLVVASTPSILGAWTALQVARRSGLPFVLLVYDLVSDLATDVFPIAGQVAALGLRRLEAKLLADADHVVALTQEMVHRIDRFSGRTKPTAVIPIWADDELLDCDPREMALECRADLGIRSDQHLVGFTGSFGLKQHLSEIVGALGELDGGVITAFVGEGLEGPHMAEVARRSSGDVRILGPRSGRSLYSFLAACDLSIVPALTRFGGTGFPSKVANILASGCPILAITSEDTELAQIIRGGDLGLVCSSCDPSAIRDAVRRALALEGAAERRQRCRAYASTHLRNSDGMSRFTALASGASDERWFSASRASVRARPSFAFSAIPRS